MYFICHFAVACTLWLSLLLSPYVSAGLVSPLHGHLHHRHALLHRRTSDAINDTNTSSELEAARQLVKTTIAEATKLNKARLDSPRRNQYKLKPGTVVGDRTTNTRRAVTSDSEEAAVPPLLTITDEIAAAAALVAEADAALIYGNISSNSQPLHKRGTFWMEGLARKGTSPWGDDASYQVFRNVKDYGAVGDGRTDDTAAINKAISDGKRCGAGCNGSSTKNAIVYLPPGIYLVSSPLIIYYGTQFIGDANDLPVIKAASSFVGLGVLTTDVYVGNGAGTDGKDNEWYVNTASFYRQIRNMRIDITSTDPGAYVCAVHYQVAQATSLQNVELIATTGTTQQGMFSENGSGGVLADITFTGGNFGFYGGNQQFTAQRLTFNGCTTAVQVIWDWGWVWKSVHVSNAVTGFRLVSDDGSGNLGSAMFMDSTFTDVTTAVVVAPPSFSTGSGTTGLVLDNVAFNNVKTGVADTSGNTLLEAQSVLNWVLGPIYNGTTERQWTSGENDLYYRTVQLVNIADPVATGLITYPYYERAKPQYESSSVNDFVHLKDLGAKGDGVTDDTAAIQSALDGNVGKIIFADAGVYLISSTVTIPVGTKIVGEAWTQLAATGSYFSDALNPRVMLRVGNSDDTGSIEMQDLIFTTMGPTPGAVLVEWNVLADEQGSAGMWDCHARLGGATGTKLTPSECPARTDGSTSEDCMAAALVMHITEGASGYFENMWLWIADHMIDDPDWTDDKNEMTMVSIFAARGLLIESRHATWLYGTASEHAVFYQYNINRAEYVFAGLIQTESPYYQPSPTAPNPFSDALDGSLSDPDYSCPGTDFDGCDSSWGVIVQDSSQIYITSAGIYTWFDTYSQDCIDTHSCQHALVLLQDNQGTVRIQQLITIGAKYSVVFGTDEGILAADNLAIESHPSWSQITILDAPFVDTHVPDFNVIDLGPCNSTTVYNTLEDMNADIGNIPDYCVGVYTLPVLYRILSSSLQNYTTMTANGAYDDKFDAYVKWVKEQTPLQLDAFMARPDGPGNKYFTCTFEEEGRNVSSATQTCPFGSWLDIGDYTDYTIWFTLNDADGFFAELLNTTGISQDWVQFGEKVVQDVTCSRPDCVSTHIYYQGYPIPADSYTIDDPKDIIEGALSGYQSVLATIGGYILETNNAGYDGDVQDIMDVLVMPVSMVAQAVDSMAEVVIIGEEEEEEEKKKLILTILSVVFLAIPFVGEFIGTEVATLLGTLGRIIDLIGAVGNAALSIYDIYEDPSSAPLAILGLLMGGTGGSLGRDAKEMSEMASLRRSMSGEDIAKMGTVIKKNDDLIQSMGSFCKA